jgi:3-hydroxyacyl-CoA dehydrogenase
MGAGIAAVAARRGTPVRLKDADLARVAKGVDAVHGILGEALANGGRRGSRWRSSARSSPAPPSGPGCAAPTS